MTWITLIITLNGQIAGVIPYRDAMACGDALPAIHAAVEAQHPDAMLQCVDSGKARVRPQARPS